MKSKEILYYIVIWAFTVSAVLFCNNVYNDIRFYGLLDPWLTTPILVGATVLLSIYFERSLSRYSYKVSQQGYSTHFKRNIFDKPFDRKTNRTKVLILISGSIILSWILSLHVYLPLDLFAELILGSIFLLYFYIIISHINNIGTFRVIRDNPSSLSGQVEVTTAFIHRRSRQNIFIFIIIWVMLFLLFLRIFFIGGFIMKFLLFVSKNWDKKSITPVKKLDASSPPEFQDFFSSQNTDLGSETHD